MPTLPPAAIAALERGQLIEAIKLTREATGLGLKESKELVERHGNGERGEGFEAVDDDDFSHSPQGRLASASGLPPAALDALKRGQVIEAVKRTREATGLGLKEAKDLVDAARSGAADGAVPGLAGAGALFDPLHEPGRVRGGGTNWLLVAIVLLCVLAGGWLLLRA